MSQNAPNTGVPVINSDDEINLTDLIRNIWRQRGLILGCALFIALAVLVFHLAKASFAVPRQVDYAISLTFLDASGKYPNGTVFSPRDIIAPAVIESVVSKGVVTLSTDKMAKALSVRFSNSLLAESEDKLNGLLANAKTPADIRTAAEIVLTDMRERTRSFVTVSLDLGLAGISSAEGVQTMTALVDGWAKLAIDRGLMNVSIDRPITPFAVGESTNLIDVYDNAAIYLKSLKNAVEQLTVLSGTSSLIVNGQTLEDISRELNTLEATDIGPLREFAYSNSAVLAEKDPAIRVRLYARQRLLTLEHERLNKLIASYDAALKQLTQASSVDVPARQGGNSSQMAGAQFDQSFLTSLLDLGNKLGGVEMRQDLFERRTKAIEDMLELEKEMAILNGTADAIYKGLDAQEILRSALTHIEAGLNKEQQQLDAFISVYRTQSLQSGGRLFIADAAPAVRGGHVQLGTRIGLHLALGLMLGAMLGMMLALMRAAMLNNRSDD